MARAADVLATAQPATPQGARATPDVLADMFTGLVPGRADNRSYLLLLRFALVNLAGVALIGAGAFQGLISPLIEADSTRLVALICVVFLFGYALAARKVLQLSWELNQLRAAIPHPLSRAGIYLREIAGRDGASRALLASALKVRLASKVAPVRHIANSLVLLGLIGTVVGFIVALSGVDPETAGDVTAIAPMVSTLITGMSIALHTTLVGSVLNIWLMVNARLLEGGTIKLVTGIVERGEAHA